MRIIVTGGCGFIGSHLVDALVNNYEVIVIDNLSTGKNINQKAHNNFITIEKYMEDYIDAWGKIDIIFHLAALPRIQPSFHNPISTYEANSTETMRALEMAKHYDCKLIYAGSSSVEHDVYANPYTYSKWLGEQHCKLYNKLYGVSVAIARFFNVYGPRQIESGPYATLMGIFQKQKREGKPLTITGDGEQRRDMTHVSDIVSGLLVMSEGKWNADVFNLGRGKNFSVNEIAKTFGGEVKYIPKMTGEAQETLADLSRKFGWEPKVNLEEYINGLQ